MSNTTPQQTNMHYLNPKFKKQLFSLKELAMSEFDIQISTEKMIQDKTYRDIVLDELGDLDSEALNGYIQLLKRTPIYIKSSTEPFALDALPSVGSQHAANITSEKPAKRNRFGLLVLLLLCFSLYIVWNKGYLPPFDLPTASAPVAAENTTSVPATDSHQPVTKQETDSGQTAINTDTKETVATVDPISLPSANRIMSFRLHGSNTIGEELAPALLEAYLKSISVEKMHWVQGKVAVERELQYIKDDKVYAIELHAHGSSTSFKDLMAGTADMGMSSRIIKEKEVEQLRPIYGDLKHVGQENIIGLDGLAVIVSPDNPINSLTTEVIAKIFAGEITNWRELGGEDFSINLYARDENSGTWDTFKNLVLKAHNKKLSSSAARLESSTDLSDEVSKDPRAIGFIGLPYINNSKGISVAASAGTSAIYPTHFTVSTEDYPLSRRLYMYAPTLANKMVKSFTRFVLSLAGQEVVKKIGLISQNIKLEKIHEIKSAPPIYNDYTEVAQRLSLNFRFKSGSNELDNKGLRDLPRLVNYMIKQQGRRIVLMGFSDSLGDPQQNIKLSSLRANVVEQALTARGLDVVAVEGFGEQLPVASNRSAFGRSKNRRVEVWVY